MTKTNKTLKTVLSTFVALCIAWAICLSCISMAASDTIEQTIEVTQTIVKENDDKTVTYADPSLSKYTYRLTPKTDGAPMPEGTKDGVYEFVLNGNEKKSIPLTFELDGAHDYQYELSRVEETPKGDTVRPETHLFGYLIESDKNGGFNIIPYTCYDNEFKIWDKVDANGNPIGITLANYLQGEKIVEPEPTTKTPDKSTTTTTRKGATTTTRSSVRTTTRTNVVTRTVARVVNTGDPYQVGLWVALLALSAGALIVLGAIRRKKENDDEES